MDLPQIPETWEWCELQELVAIGAPIIYGILQPGPDIPDGIPYVRPTEIVGDSIQAQNLRRTTPEIAQKYQRASLLEGDVLVSIVGTIGKVAIVPKELSGANITQSSVRVRPSNSVSSSYIAWLLRSPILTHQYNKNRLGTGVPRLNVGQVRELTVPLSPPHEQKRIVSKIEALQGHSSRAREALEAVGPLLEKFRQSVLASAFRGDLTKEWRQKNPDVEPAEVLLSRIREERRTRWIEAAAEKGRARAEAKAVKANKEWTPADDEKVLAKERAKAEKKYTEPEPPDTSNLPDLPEGWCWTTIESLSSRVTDGTHQTPKYIDEGIPFLVIKNIISGEIEWDSVSKWVSQETYEQCTVHCKPEFGDILYSAVGSYGTALVVDVEVPFMFQRHIAHIKPLGKIIPPEFISWALNSPHCLNQAHREARGVAQKTVTLSSLKSFSIPLPPVDEQKQMLKMIVQMADLRIPVENSQRLSLSRLEKMNQSILAKAFRGELVPQDPNDEPASVLLERIKAEREANASKKKKKATRRKKAKT